MTDREFDAPTTLGLTIYMETMGYFGAAPERWTPERRLGFCAKLRTIVTAHDTTARVVYQGNNDPDDRLPTSAIVWLDPTPDDQFQCSYAPDPFAMRRHLERNGYHVSTIHYGYDPVMA